MKTQYVAKRGACAVHTCSIVFLAMILLACVIIGLYLIEPSQRWVSGNGTVDPNVLEILPLMRTSMQTVMCAARVDPVKCLAPSVPSIVRSTVGGFKILPRGLVAGPGCAPLRVMRALNAPERSCCLSEMI